MLELLREATNCDAMIEDTFALQAEQKNYLGERNSRSSFAEIATLLIILPDGLLAP